MVKAKLVNGVWEFEGNTDEMRDLLGDQLPSKRKKESAAVKEVKEKKLSAINPHTEVPKLFEFAKSIKKQPKSHVKHTAKAQRPYTAHETALLKAVAARKTVRGEVAQLAKGFGRTEPGINMKLWELRKAMGITGKTAPAVAKRKKFGRWTPDVDKLLLDVLQSNGAKRLPKGMKEALGKQLGCSAKSVHNRMTELRGRNPELKAYGDRARPAKTVVVVKQAQAPAPVTVEIPQIKESKDEGYMLRKKPDKAQIFKAQGGHTIDELSRAAIAIANEERPVFICLDDQGNDLLYQLVKNVIANKGRMTMENEGTALGFDALRDWNAFCDEFDKRSSRVSAFFGVKNDFFVSRIGYKCSIKYGVN
jgi:hypothetical protein